VPFAKYAPCCNAACIKAVWLAGLVEPARIIHLRS
jgi:hypothetical protein